MNTDFRQYLDRVKPRLERSFELTLEKLVDGGGAFAFSGSLAPFTSGKKIRGILLCLVTETLGGNLETALPRAVAVELIQTASLIHDDFVDQHRFRRNHAALWTLEGARRAVLLGDVLFASAISMMSEAGGEECGIVSGAIAELALGAYQEPLDPRALVEVLQRGGMGPKVYQRLIHLKTAILFGAACQLGALAAPGGGERGEAWRLFGLKIGEAYQIADDLQDLEQCVGRGEIGGEELTSLAPALLFFAPELLPHLMEGLLAGGVAVTGEVLDLFQGAAVVMKKERERRLQEGVAAIAAGVPQHSLGKLVLKTPWELISLFDASSREACAP